MIIQIYAIVCMEDAESLCKLGVDHIGSVVSLEGNEERGIVSIDDAKLIVETIHRYNKVSTVIVDSTEIKEIERYIDFLHMDILHICSVLSEDQLKAMQKFLHSKGVQFMYAIPVKDKSSIKDAQIAARYVDFLMLDSPFTSKQMEGFIGATGKTHDWNISAEIVKNVEKPVILGGGLSMDNVEDAIKKVHPAGVDAKTSLDLPGGKGRKNIEKVREFVKKVRKFG